MLDQPMTSKMIAEKDGAIGHLIFNNPARHNAVSLDMWQAVAQIIDDFERDDAVRVIVRQRRRRAGFRFRRRHLGIQGAARLRRGRRRVLARFPRARGCACRKP